MSGKYDSRYDFDDDVYLEMMPDEWRQLDCASAVIEAQRDALSELRVENQRLRDALKKIALYSRPVKDGKWSDVAWCAWYAMRTAFDALQVPEPPEEE